jgi:hypothetical protein
MAVADAQDDDVAFVPLDILQVLNKQSDELAIRLALPFCFEASPKILLFVGQAAQGLLDLGLNDSTFFQRLALISDQNDRWVFGITRQKTIQELATKRY